jgi:putative Mg2+ transporter-C (MgtC) family protein
MIEWLFVERLVISAVLGGLIGVEREMHAKPAGFRTHVLVCVGASMLALISVLISEDFGSPVDVSRVAAGVVTGIGFLAAGSIFRDKDRVRGLTTAADIWVLASIGLAVGFGYYLLAIVATVVSLIVLIVGRVLDYYLSRKN